MDTVESILKTKVTFTTIVKEYYFSDNTNSNILLWFQMPPAHFKWTNISTFCL